MSNPKFTRGPLETDIFNVKGHNVYWVKDSLNRGVCECFMQYPFAGKPGITGDEAEANAHLYAAAPEMYEELERFIELCHENDCGDYARRAEQILRKARGESENKA